MAQNYSDNPFSSGNAGQTDLQTMENNFACLKSLFSGPTQPPNTVAGMPWFNTTKDMLRLRNAANGAWLGLMHGDASQKIWVYRDSAMSGWVVDSSVSDKVLSLKGGSTYVTGGLATQGSWTHGHANTFSATGDPHNHQWYLSNTGSEGFVDKTFDAAGGQTNVTAIHKDQGAYEGYPYSHIQASSGTLSGGGGLNNCFGVDAYTEDASVSISISGSVTDNSTLRPAAATGTLQYMDLT